MDRQQLIDMLNKDMAEEHAAILRYLIHSYLEGEDTAMGAKLLSRAREEMWHMHWLGMIVGQLGGEPNMEPAEYPHDATNRATILESYVKYEKMLVPHYAKEAEMVDDPHIRRVLQREGWESRMHADKFQKMRDKLSPEEAAGLPGAENELSEALAGKIQESVTSKYRQMLQTIRDAWVFQEKGVAAWQRMDFSMTKMKQLAHSAEEVAENGVKPDFSTGGVLEAVKTFEEAISKAVNDLKKTADLHRQLKEDPEARQHGGLISNLDLTIRQEDDEIGTLGDWQRK